MTIELSSAQRISVLIGLVVAGLVGLLFLDPIPQDPAYHHFADNRTLVGIPNFNDVFSNVGFAIVGSLGVMAVMGARAQTIFTQRRDARPYLVFFIGLGLVSLGSSYYHLAPSNGRLFWDRLPMSICFMAFTAAIVADRIDNKTGNTWLLPVLVILGFLSLIYWHWTESMGRGDLRFYGLVQFFPMVAMPLVCWLFPEHRYTAGRYILWVVGWYALAKVFEHFDGEVFALLGYTVSGHTLKHYTAAIATYFILRMLLAPRSTVNAG